MSISASVEGLKLLQCFICFINRDLPYFWAQTNIHHCNAGSGEREKVNRDEAFLPSRMRRKINTNFLLFEVEKYWIWSTRCVIFLFLQDHQCFTMSEILELLYFYSTSFKQTIEIFFFIDFQICFGYDEQRSDNFVTSNERETLEYGCRSMNLILP